MRLRRKPWIDKALTEVLESYLYMEKLENGFAVSGSSVFPGKEICLEIGCGKGRFITGMAALHPEKAFIGIETARDIAFFAARKAKEAKLDQCLHPVWERRACRRMVCARRSGAAVFKFQRPLAEGAPCKKAPDPS
jgi:tRNA G46 methylase TrmB